jgi:hypothetical protein
MSGNGGNIWGNPPGTQWLQQARNDYPGQGNYPGQGGEGFAYPIQQPGGAKVPRDFMPDAPLYMPQDPTLPTMSPSYPSEEDKSLPQRKQKWQAEMDDLTAQAHSLSTQWDEMKKQGTDLTPEGQALFHRYMDMMTQITDMYKAGSPLSWHGAQAARGVEADVQGGKDAQVMMQAVNNRQLLDWLATLANLGPGP